MTGCPIRRGRRRSPGQGSGSGTVTFGNANALSTTASFSTNGSYVLRLSASDSLLSASDDVTVTVNPWVLGTTVFGHPSPITIPSIGAGTPYPSTIDVSRLGGVISQVTVTLSNLSHAWPDDLDLLLVGPTGQKALLMSDAGGGKAVSGVNLLLSDTASANLPDNAQIVSGTYRPTNLRSGDRFPAPAPGGPYGSALSAFVGLSPNGVWSLYVNDDGQGDQGLMGGGWSLTISTVEGAGLAVTNPPVADEPPASTATLSLVGGTEGSAATLQVRGLPWQKYVVEASEDLVSWTPLGVVCDATGVGYFVDSDAVRHGRRFYRAMENP